MLDFCPYELDMFTRKYRKIDMNNLAYEIVFMNGYNIDTLKKTVISGEYTKFIETTIDHKIKYRYNDENVHYILPAARKNGASGLQKMMKAIEEGNKVALNVMNVPQDDDIGLGESSFSSEEENSMLEIKLDEKTGNYFISYSEDSAFGNIPIMRAIPCCPNCHMPLPVGWKKAEEFYPISLLGHTRGGKTTFLISLIANNWDSLERLKSGWTISAAHENLELQSEALDDSAGYEWLKKAADDLVNKGIIPDRTNPGFDIKPLFLNVITSDNHRMIVGLYDNSGENLNKMSENDSRMLLLSNVEAHIYIIEPDQMKINIHSGKSKSQEERETEAKLMNIEEQGDYQSAHRNDKPVRAGDLLPKAESADNRKTSGRLKENPENVLAILQKYRNLLVKMEEIERIEDQHICVTLTKCDLLKDEAIINQNEYSYVLFQGGNKNTLFEQETARNAVVKKLFTDYVFDSADREQFFENNNIKSVSYHCISALGCATEEIEKDGSKLYKLKGKYNPIRVAEPLAYCIRKKIGELSWEQNSF